MTQYFFSRARLRQDAPIGAFLPHMKSDGSNHALIWSLFPQGRGQGREFLFRQTDQGWFYILSAHPPRDTGNLFELDPPKPYAPSLRPGQRLRFSLRANPVIRRRISGTRRSKKVDIVMDALYQLPDKSQRAARRQDMIYKSGSTWLSDQGQKHGFTLGSPSSDQPDELQISRYFKNPVKRGPGKDTMRFWSLDFDGVLSVANVEQFQAALFHGLGASKGFGCGLMMIRPI